MHEHVLFELDDAAIIVKCCTAYSPGTPSQIRHPTPVIALVQIRKLAEFS